MVAAVDGFHGRTMGALALTGQPAKADPFRPLPGEVVHVPYGDVDALAEAVDDATAMVILEPIQGEAGVVVPPPGYLTAAREITARHGALLALDEVQTGVGRTGHWFAHQAEGVDARRRHPRQGPRRWTADRRLHGLHRPARRRWLVRCHLAATAAPSAATRSAARPALAVLRTIAAEGLLDHVKRVGERLRRGIEALGHPLVTEVRGAGLLLGVVLAAPAAAALVDRAARRRLPRQRRPSRTWSGSPRR